MEKWIFVNNITSLDKLYYLTKTISENEVNEKNHANLLMDALNLNGANRNEANNHPINFTLFYNMVYVDNGIYKLTTNGEHLIHNYNEIISNKKYRSIFFFEILNNIKYPNIAVETSSLYSVRPFNILFKLLCEERVSNKITIDEFETLLSLAHTDSDYELLVSSIKKYRNGEKFDINCEKIAQVSTVVAGWCNQFNVMKKEGDFIMLSDDLKEMLPILSKESNISILPYSNDFNCFVLKKYLFDGVSMSSIENEFYHSNDRRGFLVKDVLDYFKINNDQNKALYKEKSIDFVCSILDIQSDNRYKMISKVLKEEKFNNNNYFFEQYKEFYEKNISLLEKEIEEKTQEKLRIEFINEYPLERIKELTLEEYVLGSDKYKESLSYKLEFGKYKYTGAGIGGSTAAKFGIYMREAGIYFGKGGKIDNPQEYWEKLKNELYSYLIDIPNMAMPINISEKYPYLKGMSMIVTKLSYLYYPEKFVNICSKNWLTLLSNSFGFNISNKYSAEQLSFELSKEIRSRFNEVNNHSPQYIGATLYRFLNKYILNSDEDKIESSEINEVSRIKNGYNMIYYGTPGCGKSYLVNKEYNMDEYEVFRTTFYPDYSNSDFVGQILPKVENDKVYYQFHEGPFTTALFEAYANPEKKICLIIEEINRGNASAIFGDIFQLLDRDINGKSTYEIDNYLIKKHFNSCGFEEYNKVSIPSNLWIIATMNSSDQNVYLLDTAFKRRWRMNRIVNVFDDSNKLAKMKIPGSSYTWKEFVNSINKAILDNNPGGFNGEDKQIGVYFVSENELISESTTDSKKAAEAFVEKVLMYIWEDIAKIDPSSWFTADFKSFDELVSAYNEKHLSIFKNQFENDIITKENVSNEEEI